MDSSDALVNGEVYWAHEIIAYGCSGGQKAGEQQEMVDMSIPTWTRGVRRQEKKSVSPQGSLGTQGGTLDEESISRIKMSTSSLYRSQGVHTKLRRPSLETIEQAWFADSITHRDTTSTLYYCDTCKIAVISAAKLARACCSACLTHAA